MFAPPPVIETRVFARVPDALLKNSEGSFFTKVLGRQVGSFLEGPSFDKAGNLYCVDVAHARIFRIDPQGNFEVFVSYDGQPNGLKIHKDGRIFVADRLRGIVIIDPNSRTLEFPVSGPDLERFKGPNDLVFSSEGDVYFTDQGMSDFADRTGRIYRLRADGRLEKLMDGLVSPNGIALDESGRTLYIALTRSNRVIKALVMPDGRVTRVQNFIQMSGGAGPDGLAVDEKGGLIVAHPHFGAIWVFDEKGEPTVRVNLCEGHHGTNIAFGGPDRRRLYITESGSGTIQVADLPVPGLKMFSHQE